MILEQDRDQLITVAIEIILHAGNARTKAKEALQLMKQKQSIDAENLLQEASLDIQHAHRAQTNIIQKEAQGASYSPPLLFIHAQDTLMSIQSELGLIKELVTLYGYIFQLVEKEEQL